MSEESQKKFITLIRFATKAGKVVFGLDSIEKRISKAELIVFDNTMAQNSQKKLCNICTQFDKPSIACNILLEDVVNKQNCKAIAICDFQFATALQKVFNQQ